MMRMVTKELACVLAIGAAVTSGCGRSHGRPDDAIQPDECQTGRAARVTEREANARLGFDASDVLAFVEGTHASDLQWFPPTDVPYDATLDRDDLTLEVERSGELHVVDLPPATGAHARGDRECSRALEIEATVRVTSANGALDESFEAVIVARDAEVAELHHEFAVDDAFGDFASERLTSMSAELTLLEMTAEFSPGQVSGSISGRFVEAETGSELGPVELAMWPAGDLCHGLEPATEVLRVPVRSDSTMAQAPVALLNDADPVRFVWSDGSATGLDLEATQAGIGCAVRPESWLPVLTYPVTPIFTYPVKLAAATRDGRLTAELEGTLWVTADLNAQHVTVAVLQTRTEYQSAEELKAKAGITGVELNGHPATLRFSVYYGPKPGMPEGTVVLTGQPIESACDAVGGECITTELLKGSFQR